MKILVLNGSPKRDASDTLCMTRAFLDGMNDAAPQDVHTLHTVDCHIEYCTGCFACMRNGGSCIHNDDMKAILREGADKVSVNSAGDSGKRSAAVQLPVVLLRYARVAQSAAGPHSAPFEHGDAKGGGSVRPRGAGGFQPPSLSYDLRLRFPEQQA